MEPRMMSEKERLDLLLGSQQVYEASKGRLSSIHSAQAEVVSQGLAKGYSVKEDGLYFMQPGKAPVRREGELAQRFFPKEEVPERRFSPGWNINFPRTNIRLSRGSGPLFPPPLRRPAFVRRYRTA